MGLAGREGYFSITDACIKHCRALRFSSPPKKPPPFLPKGQSLPSSDCPGGWRVRCEWPRAGGGGCWGESQSWIAECLLQKPSLHGGRLSSIAERAAAFNAHRALITSPSLQMSAAFQLGGWNPSFSLSLKAFDTREDLGSARRWTRFPTLWKKIKP